MRRTKTGADAGKEKGLGSLRKGSFGWNRDREIFEVLYLSHDEQA